MSKKMNNLLLRKDNIERELRAVKEEIKEEQKVMEDSALKIIESAFEELFEQGFKIILADQPHFIEDCDNLGIAIRDDVISIY